MRWQKIFYTKGFRAFFKGCVKEHPICFQILGLCSTLAVSNKVENALAMGLGVMFVVMTSSAAVSLLRKYIPSNYRIITYMTVTSALVIFVDQYFRAFFPSISKQLGPYVALIITNCIVMGRHEAFAIANNVWHSLLDGFGNSLGYLYTLIILASIREILAFGTFLNMRVMPATWTPWVVMAMAPGAFFLLALYLWIFRTLAKIPPEKGG